MSERMRYRGLRGERGGASSVVEWGEEAMSVEGLLGAGELTEEPKLVIRLPGEGASGEGLVDDEAAAALKGGS